MAACRRQERPRARQDREHVSKGEAAMTRRTQLLTLSYFCLRRSSNSLKPGVSCSNTVQAKAS